MSTPNYRYLPAEPLVSAIRRQEMVHGSLKKLSAYIANRHDWSYDVVNRNLYTVLKEATQSGVVNDRLADKMAVGMGYHPCELWPCEWWQDGSVETQELLAV